MSLIVLRNNGDNLCGLQENNIGSTSQGKDFFANYFQREFNPIELVMLEPIAREYVMAIVIQLCFWELASVCCFLIMLKPSKLTFFMTCTNLNKT